MQRRQQILSVLFSCALLSRAPSASIVQNAGAARPSSAVAPAVSLPVAALLAQAETARLALHFDEAHARVNDAEALAERTRDQAGLAAAHRMRGNIFNWAGRSSDANTWLTRALSESEAIGDRRGMARALMGLTSTAISDGDSAHATEYGERAMPLLKELDDEGGRATVMLNLLSISQEARPEDPRFDEVLAVAARLGDENLRAATLKTRGGQQFTGGDLSAAEATLEAAAEAYRRSNDVSGEAATSLMIGRVHRAHGDDEGALEHYQRAIDLLAPTTERRTLIEAVNSRGVALAAMGRPQEAIAAYERGLALARETGNTRYIDFMLGNLGGGLLAAGDAERALPVLKEVLSRNPEPYIAGFRYAQLANAYGLLRRFAEAVDPIDQSIRITREQKQIDRLDGRLDDRAWILGELGRYEEALADSREALSVIEQVRRTLLPAEFLKRGYGDRVQRYYDRAVDLLTRLNRAGEALAIAEQGRARVLLDALAAREQTLLKSATSPAAADAARAPRSNSVAQPLPIDDIKAVAARQGATLLVYWVRDTQTVVWTVTPEGLVDSTPVPVGGDRLTRLVAATTAALRPPPQLDVPRKMPASAASPGNPSQAESFVPLRGLGLLSLKNDDRSAWRELYASIVEPIRGRLPGRGGRVVIVPHGPLAQLAFGALQTPEGRYLIEDFDISLAPSISMLAYTSRREQSERAAPAGPWMLVGNPSSLPQVEGRPLAPLPGAQAEIAAIAALAPRRNVVRLDAAGANEDALAAALASARPSVVHFATHGFVPDDPKAPPFLVVNRRGDTAAEDGRLTMDEIYGLTMTPDLVVLSACRTGTGAVGSDGVIGLARAFFYAGAPSVIATMWDVPDATTSLLMPAFYRGYAATRAKSASLRSAQLALLADLRAGRVSVATPNGRVALPEHPLLWAGFVMIGEPGSTPMKSTRGGQHDR